MQVSGNHDETSTFNSIRYQAKREINFLYVVSLGLQFIKLQKQFFLCDTNILHQKLPHPSESNTVMKWNYLPKFCKDFQSSVPLHENATNGQRSLYTTLISSDFSCHVTVHFSIMGNEVSNSLTLVDALTTEVTPSE